MGILLDCSDLITNHNRLLRSLWWGDEDYEDNVLEVINEIIQKDAYNYEGIIAMLHRKYPASEVSEFISSAHTEPPRKIISFSPQVFDVPDKVQNEKLVAVMLPFKFAETFTTIKQTCEKRGLECKKADDIWENATFIQDIFDLIFTCKVVIADFTGKNPNVFYEVGIAHTLGKTVIPITQSIDDVPSDLLHHRALKYLPNSQGYIDFSADLEKRLEVLIPSKW